MPEHTLISNDILYLAFYLQEEDPTTGSSTYYNLSGASSIWFRMRKYGNTINAISGAMSTVVTPSNALGYCRILATIPSTIGTYYSEVEVYTSSERITWIGPVYKIKEELG